MRTYICLYKNQRRLVEASSSYEAQKIAAGLFKARKRYDVHVYLADEPISTATL